VRVGRYGPYLQRAEADAEAGTAPAPNNGNGNGEGGPNDRVSLPEGLAPDELTPEKVEELFLGGGGERKLGEHPETGEPIVVRSGRFGPYISSGDRNSSLLRSQSPDSVTLEEALKLLTLPRVVGVAPDGVEVYASAGRYGPYVKKGDEFRSLDSEDKIFTVTLEEATTLLAAPKPRQRRAAAPPLRELGVDPLTERNVVIKNGRFGPYVTDEETNASLRRGQTVEAMTIDLASEMLSEKRAQGPATPRKKATKAAKAAAGAEAAGGETAKPAKKAVKKAAKKAVKKAAPKKAAAKRATK